jgi:hypothetical protein
MEKTIETIWKEGFLKSDALVVPKLNDLYHRKSQHIVDKLTRMLKTNLVAILGGSFFVVGLSYAVNIPYMGIGMFVILNVLVAINRKLMKGLSRIDKNVNSFEYLKTFDGWMKEQVSMNKKISHFLYPLVFLSVVIGFWFGGFGGDIPGEIMTDKLVTRFPDMVLVYGLPLYGLLGGILVLVLLAYFGGRIYQWDLNIVYGRVLKKLDEIIADMEDLRN